MAALRAYHVRQHYLQQARLEQRSALCCKTGAESVCARLALQQARELARQQRLIAQLRAER